MVMCYLDVTLEQLMRNVELQKLQSDVKEHAIVATENPRTTYIRLLVCASSREQLYTQLVRMTMDECIPWMLQHEKHTMLFLSERSCLAELEQRAKQRLTQIQSQLYLLIRDDIGKFMHLDRLMPNWNINGYFYFAAQKVKWMVRTLLQEEYQAIREEREREGFISLLQFCVEVQPSLISYVKLTLDKTSFTVLDGWGNDLQQLYLDALPEEEYRDVQLNDLVLSILMTLLPETIHIYVTEAQLAQHAILLRLLRQVFSDRVEVILLTEL